MTWLIPTIVLSLVLILALVGMAMTAITLPGIWTMAAGALLLLVGFPEYIGWWTVGAIFGIAAFSELVDFVASALGVKRMGGSKSGAVVKRHCIHCAGCCRLQPAIDSGWGDAEGNRRRSYRRYGERGAGCLTLW